MRADGGDDLVDRRAHPVRIRAVDPSDHAAFVEQERGGEKEVLARIERRDLASDQRRRHAAVVPDAERIHQRTADVRQNADRELEPSSEAFRYLRRVDAHRHHLDPAVEDLTVALAELAELRRAEGSPAAAIEDEQVPLAPLRGQIEDAALRRGQPELGEALANARSILAGAVHRVAEEEPDEEREERRAH